MGFFQMHIVSFSFCSGTYFAVYNLKTFTVQYMEVQSFFNFFPKMNQRTDLRTQRQKV